MICSCTSLARRTTEQCEYPDSILAAAQSVGVRVELFDWDLGGDATDGTSRIGAWSFR
jgi:hypothetical protein